MYNINIATPKNIKNLYRLYQPPQSSYYIVLSLFFFAGASQSSQRACPNNQPSTFSLGKNYKGCMMLKYCTWSISCQKNWSEVCHRIFFFLARASRGFALHFANALHVTGLVEGKSSPETISVEDGKSRKAPAKPPPPLRCLEGNGPRNQWLPASLVKEHWNGYYDLLWSIMLVYIIKTNRCLLYGYANRIRSWLFILFEFQF